MAYNGYPNWETWDVALWIDNDEWTQEEVLEVARLEDGRHDWLREWVENNLLDDAPTFGLAADLFTAAMGEVDWTYLEDSYAAQVKESEEEEEEADNEE